MICCNESDHYLYLLKLDHALDSKFQIDLNYGHYGNLFHKS